MIDWNAYRELFPVTKNHRYFMTAGAGPIPTPVLQAIGERYKEVSEHGGGAYQKNIEIMENCRKLIAKLINADAEDIAFIPSVSFGMNALALSMPKGSKLLIPEEDFPASFLPWSNAGHSIEYISSVPDLQDNLLKSSSQENTSLVTSFVQYSSGYKIDLNGIKPEFLNGTQGVGVFPIDVKTANMNALVSACHKWLFCGEGLAFMYIKRDFFKTLEPAMVGWRSSPFAMQFNQDFRYYDSAKIFELGWANMTIFAGLEKALEMVLEIGVENIAERVNNLMTYLVDGLKKLNIPTMSNYDAMHRSGIVLLGPFADLDKTLQNLLDKDMYVTKRGNGIRLALHFYNNEEDIDAFLKVVCHAN